MIELSDFILNEPQFEAKIFYLLPEDGGRLTAVSSGYRGQFYYAGKNWDAAQQFIDKPFCEPGNAIDVLMQTSSPSNHVGQLFINKSFEIREGAKVVGIGKINKILFDKFQKTNLNSYEKKVVDLIIRKNQFDIKTIHDLDGVKSFYFNQTNYLSVLPLIKQKKWYLIDDSNDSNKKKNFNEYLYIEIFTDQRGQEYAATIYDNDELWQDLQLIDIFKL